MTLLEIIFLIGAGYGFLLIATILLKKNSLPANKYLAILTTLFSLNFIQIYLEDSGFYRSFPHILYADASVALLYGPLIFFFVSSLAGRMEKFKIIHLAHFIPFVIHFLLILPFYIKTGEAKIIAFERYTGTGLTHGYNALLTYFLKLIQYFSYIAVSSFIVKNFVKTEKGARYKWVYPMLLLNGFFVLILIILVTGHIFYVFTLTIAYTRISYFWAALWIYAVTYMAMKHGDDFIRKKENAVSPQEIHDLSEDASEEKQDEIGNDENQNDEDETGQEKYGKSKIPDDMLFVYKRQIETYINNKKPYHNSDLSIGLLADELGIPQNTLSQIINSCWGTNFQNFINTFRIEEAKAILKDTTKDLNIIEAAFQAGFKSKSTFNTIFKKATGMTPTEYRRQFEK